MKKRVLAVLLALTLLVSMSATSVFATGEETVLTLESILGFSAVKSDLKVTFDENFDSDATGYVAQAVDLATRGALGETALCEGFEITDESGEMALKVVNPTITGKSPAFGWGIGASPGWNPLSATSAVRFRAKLNEGASMGILINRTRTNITLSENSIGMLGGTNGDKNIGVAPGTGWNTYLVTTDGTGYSLYIQPDNGTWSHVHTCDAFQNSKGDWGVVFNVSAGQSAYVDYVETLVEDTSISTEDLLGANVVTTNYVKFDREYKENGSKLEMTQEQSAYNYTTAVMGEEYMELEGTEWSFGKALTATDTNVTFGLDKPIEMRVKLPEDGKLSIQGPHTVRGGGRYYIELTPSRTRAYGGDGVKKSGYDKAFDTTGIGTEWTTLLLKLIPNEQAVTKPGDDTSVSATIPKYSYEIYYQDDDTQRWTKAVTTVGYRGDNCYQLSLSGGAQGAPVLVDYIKFYDTDGAVEETRTKPEAANLLYYNEEFNATPDAENITMGSGTAVASDVLELTTDGSKAGTFDVNQTEIPVGGYAEFKFKSGAKTELIFAGTTEDGKENLSIQFGKLTGAYHNSDKQTLGANEANIWHTYRLVRVNESGYHLYKKTEGDDNWQIDLENMSTKGFASDSVATKLAQYAKEDGSVAKAQFDYLKIYGPAGEEKLIITDGITTLNPTNAAILNYPGQLRAIVNGVADGNQLIFAGYAGNNLVKVELHNVADLENGESIFDATDAKETITKVKVFLWDGFSGLTPVSTARNFGVSSN